VIEPVIEFVDCDDLGPLLSEALKAELQVVEKIWSGREDLNLRRFGGV